jgi:peptidase inhibitor family I36
MTRALSGCVVVVLSLCMAGCEDTSWIILGPTPTDQGIVIFIHADYTGSSQAMNVDVRDLTRAQGPCSGGAEGEVPSWKDCVSSVRVLPGWTATLYDEKDYKGRSVTITSDAPDLRNLPGPCDGNFNDCALSIRVAKQ